MMIVFRQFYIYQNMNVWTENVSSSVIDAIYHHFTAQLVYTWGPFY